MQLYKPETISRDRFARIFFISHRATLLYYLSLYGEAEGSAPTCVWSLAVAIGEFSTSVSVASRCYFRLRKPVLCIARVTPCTGISSARKLRREKNFSLPPPPLLRLPLFRKSNTSWNFENNRPRTLRKCSLLASVPWRNSRGMNTQIVVCKFDSKLD